MRKRKENYFEGMRMKSCLIKKNNVSDILYIYIYNNFSIKQLKLSTSVYTRYITSLENRIIGNK